MNDKTVLLIGNDINSISENHYSWKNLLDDLVNYVGAKGKVENSKNKPFPLLYEEINLQSYRGRKKNESQIKTYISNKIKELESNEIHERLIDLGIKNILTTNYDLTFEKVSIDDTNNLKNQGIVKESTFSLFRRNIVNDHSIWHIHGDANYAESIILGYKQYGDYLQKLRNYIITGTKKNYKKYEFLPISKRLRENKLQYLSWIDYFFTHDVYILGLSLDFVEIHLWWLLTVKARFEQDKNIRLSNNIYYYYPRELENNMKNKLQIFQIYNIKCIPVDRPNEEPETKRRYYSEIINRISNNI